MKVLELAQELERQAGTKRDVIVPTDQMEAVIHPTEAEIQANRDDLVAPAPDHLKLQFPMPNNEGTQSFGLTDWAHRQLAEKCGIPIKYYQKLLEADMFELLKDNINAWIRSRDQRLIRMLDGNVRAILSDKYRIMDNEDVLLFALEQFRDYNVDIKRCDLSETRMFVKAVVPHMEAEIKAGDKVIQGLMLSNSEVGSGSFKVQPYLFRQICSNGMIGEHSIARIHLGAKREAGELIYTDRTKQLQDETLLSEIRDVIASTFNQDIFLKWVDQLKHGTEVVVDEPVDAVDNVVNRFKLPQAYKDSILSHFVKEGDPTQYGLSNALTRAAQDFESYETQIELETIGGRVSMMEDSDFQKKIAPRAVA